MSRRAPWGPLIASVMLLAVAFGFLAVDGVMGEPDLTAEPGSPADHLAELTVEPEGPIAGYEREAFGAGWATTSSGCDTRDLVLADESTVPVTLGPGDCRVGGGRWVSIYDGVTTADPSDLEVDHVVALAEAWASGASEWWPAERVDFANDVTRPDALIAVTAATNRSKSDRDPAEWMPPNRDAWCRYATAWVEIKHTYGLSIDQAEHDALTGVLADCPGGAS